MVREGSWEWKLGVEADKGRPWHMLVLKPEKAKVPKKCLDPGFSDRVVQRFEEPFKSFYSTLRDFTTSFHAWWVISSYGNRMPLLPQGITTVGRYKNIM